MLGGKARVGLIATSPFDRIRIEFGGLVATISVYAPVIERFCNTSPTLACNTPTSLTAPGHSVFIDPNRTGITTNVACLGCTITDPDNIIDGDQTNSASIALTAGVSTTASVAVKNAFITYPASTSSTFVGFDISSTALVDVGVFDRITVSTYISGNANPVQSVSGANLVSTNSSLLSGTGRRTVGFLATQNFDEVRLTITKAAGVSLATINVYGVVLTKFCAGPSVACSDNTIPKNTLTPLTNPTHAVYVDGNNTGFPGAACVACAINNSENVIDADASNFATVVLTAGVSTSATFAVANAVDTYPVNSFAGFDIQTSSVLSANVVGSAVISLYNNGALVQTGSGSAIVVGATTNILNGTTRQVVGIVATVPYDEVKITFPSLVGASLGTINIYSAIFEKTCAATIVCNTSYNLSNPTFPVVIDAARTGVTGLVSAATTIQNPWNVVSADATDFARINNTASIGTNASIAVLDPISTYPTGTFAGFTVKRALGLVTADLLGALTISTYNDGVLQETRTGNGSLLDLSLIHI